MQGDSKPKGLDFNCRKGLLTSMITEMFWSANILLANSEPRYDSRLFRYFVARSATVGIPP